MSYIDPKTVIAPKNVISDVEVIYDAGKCEQSWAVARLRWHDQETLGIRWNGDPHDRSIGTPQARGIPTWFIVPGELQDAVLEMARKLSRGDHEELKAAYEEMAADTDREREAVEWTEGLIGDSSRE